jgi:hypothetical protein
MTYITRIKLANPHNKDIKVNIWKRKGRKNINLLHTIVVPMKSNYEITINLPILEDNESIHARSRSRFLRINMMMDCIVNKII